MSYAARHPDLFSMALSYSGAPDIAFDPDAHLGAIAIINATEVGLDHVAPDSIFGSPVTDEINWAAHDPATLATNLRWTRLSLLFGNGFPGPLDTAGSRISAPRRSSRGLGRRQPTSTTGWWRSASPHLRSPTAPARTPGRTGRAICAWTIGRSWPTSPIPRPLPSPISYTSADDRYSAYGWRVVTERQAREFSTLTGANCRGFSLAGSGAAAVTTPRCLAPGRGYTATVAGPDGRRQFGGRADASGRVTVPVTLGPSNPFPQDSAAAGLLGTAVRTATARIVAQGRKPTSRRKPSISFR